jgi:hypothetical protein
MPTVRFTYTGHRVNEAGIRRLFTGPNSAAMRDLGARADRVERRARQLVGVDTTRLIRSIRQERGAGFIDIVAGRPGATPYILPHHDGARPHVIRPRRAKALRFVIGGRVVFARKVNHPGSVGTQFLRRGLDAAR